MGVNNFYSQSRSHILMWSPIHTLNQACALIVNDESQEFVVATTRILGSNPTNQLGNYEIAMYSRAKGNQNQNQRFKRNYNVHCEFCKMKSHSKENCYKIVGYHVDFKNNRRGNVGTNAPYNVNVLTEKGSSAQDHQQATTIMLVFNYE